MASAQLSIMNANKLPHPLSQAISAQEDLPATEIAHRSHSLDSSSSRTSVSPSSHSSSLSVPSSFSFPSHTIESSGGRLSLSHSSQSFSIPSLSSTESSSRAPFFSLRLSTCSSSQFSASNGNFSFVSSYSFAEHQRAASDKSAHRIQFFVKTLNGSTIAINDLSCLSTVASLKRLISKKESIPSECQQLVYGGKLISDDALTLKHYKIENHSTIHLSSRLLAGAQEDATAAIQKAVDERIKPLSQANKVLASAAIAGAWTSNSERREPTYTNPTHNGTDLIVQTWNISMTRLKLTCLRPGEWLNDEVINMRMSALQERDEQLCAASTGRKRSHFFNTFFMSKLLDTGNTKNYTYAQVKRWTKEIDIFELERIYIPINIGNGHWDLAILDMQTFKSRNMDSMKRPGSNDRLKYHTALMRWLIDEKADKKDERGPLVQDFIKQFEFIQVDAPQQSNGFDCGVFVMAYADFDSLDLPLLFNQSHMEDFRLRSIWDIVANDGRVSYNFDVDLAAYESTRGALMDIQHRSPQQNYVRQTKPFAEISTDSQILIEVVVCRKTGIYEYLNILSEEGVYSFPTVIVNEIIPKCKEQMENTSMLMSTILETPDSSRHLLLIKQLLQKSKKTIEKMMVEKVLEKLFDIFQWENNLINPSFWIIPDVDQYDKNCYGPNSTHMVVLFLHEFAVFRDVKDMLWSEQTPQGLISPEFQNWLRVGCPAFLEDENDYYGNSGFDNYSPVAEEEEAAPMDDDDDAIEISLEDFINVSIPIPLPGVLIQIISTCFIDFQSVAPSRLEIPNSFNSSTATERKIKDNILMVDLERLRALVVDSSFWQKDTDASKHKKFMQVVDSAEHQGLKILVKWSFENDTKIGWRRATLVPAVLLYSSLLLTSVNCSLGELALLSAIIALDSRVRIQYNGHISLSPLQTSCCLPPLLAFQLASSERSTRGSESDGNKYDQFSWFGKDGSLDFETSTFEEYYRGRDDSGQDKVLVEQLSGFLEQYSSGGLSKEQLDTQLPMVPPGFTPFPKSAEIFNTVLAFLVGSFESVSRSKMIDTNAFSENLLLMYDQLSEDRKRQLKEGMVARTPPKQRLEISENMGRLSERILYNCAVSGAAFDRVRPLFKETTGLNLVRASLVAVLHNTSIKDASINEVLVYTQFVSPKTGLGKVTEKLKSNDFDEKGGVCATDPMDAADDDDAQATNIEAKPEAYEEENADAEATMAVEEEIVVEEESLPDNKTKSSKRRLLCLKMVVMNDVLSVLRLPFKSMLFAKYIAENRAFGVKNVDIGDGDIKSAVILRVMLTSDAVQAVVNTKDATTNSLTSFSMILNNMTSYMRDSIDFACFPFALTNYIDHMAVSLIWYREIATKALLKLDNQWFTAHGHVFIVELSQETLRHANDMALQMAITGKESWQKQQICASDTPRDWKNCAYSAALALVESNLQDYVKTHKALETRFQMRALADLENQRRAKSENVRYLPTPFTTETVAKKYPLPSTTLPSILQMGVFPICSKLNKRVNIYGDDEPHGNMEQMMTELFHTIQGLTAHLFQALLKSVALNEPVKNRRQAILEGFSARIKESMHNGITFGYVEWDEKTSTAKVGGSGKQQFLILQYLSSDAILNYNDPTDGSVVKIFDLKPVLRQAWIALIDLFRSIFQDLETRSFNLFIKLYPRLQRKLSLYGLCLAALASPSAIKPLTLAGCHTLITQIANAVKAKMTIKNFSCAKVNEMLHRRLLDTAQTPRANKFAPVNNPQMIERNLAAILQNSLLVTSDHASQPIKRVASNKVGARTAVIMRDDGTTAPGKITYVSDYFTVQYDESLNNHSKGFDRFLLDQVKKSSVIRPLSEIHGSNNLLCACASTSDFGTFIFGDGVNAMSTADKALYYLSGSVPPGGPWSDAQPVMDEESVPLLQTRPEIIDIKVEPETMSPTVENPILRASMGSRLMSLSWKFWQVLKARNMLMITVEIRQLELASKNRRIDGGHKKEPIKRPFLSLGDLSLRDRRLSSKPEHKKCFFDAVKFSIWSKSPVSQDDSLPSGVLRLTFRLHGRVAGNAATYDAYHFQWRFSAVKSITSHAYLPVVFEGGETRYKIVFYHIELQEAPIKAEMFTSTDSKTITNFLAANAPRLEILGVTPNWISAISSKLTFVVLSDRSKSSKRLASFCNNSEYFPRHVLKSTICMTEFYDDVLVEPDENTWTTTLLEGFHSPFAGAPVAAAAAAYQKNQLVEAQCKNKNVTDKEYWYKARVENVNNDSEGSYKIQYFRTIGNDRKNYGIRSKVLPAEIRPDPDSIQSNTAMAVDEQDLDDTLNEEQLLLETFTNQVNHPLASNLWSVRAESVILLTRIEALIDTQTTTEERRQLLACRCMQCDAPTGFDDATKGYNHCMNCSAKSLLDKEAEMLAEAAAVFRCVRSVQCSLCKCYRRYPVNNPELHARLQADDYDFYCELNDWDERSICDQDIEEGMEAPGDDEPVASPSEQNQGAQPAMPVGGEMVDVGEDDSIRSPFHRHNLRSRHY